QIVTPGPTVAPLASRRPFPGFSGITTTKSIGNSTFHSLQAKVERRVASGLSVLGSYTYSKALGNADISTVGGGTFLGGAQNYLNGAGERSPTAFDIRHRLSVAAIYDIPLFNNAPSRVVRAVLGGWQAGVIITEQTGFSANLAGVGDTTGTGIGSRPTRGPRPKGELSRGAPPPRRWLNTRPLTP